jgi:hypothetical protein
MCREREREITFESHSSHRNHSQPYIGRPSRLKDCADLNGTDWAPVSARRLQCMHTFPNDPSEPTPTTRSQHGPQTCTHTPVWAYGALPQVFPMGASRALPQHTPVYPHIPRWAHVGVGVPLWMLGSAHRPKCTQAGVCACTLTLMCAHKRPCMHANAGVRTQTLVCACRRRVDTIEPVQTPISAHGPAQTPVYAHISFYTRTDTDGRPWSVAARGNGARSQVSVRAHVGARYACESTHTTVCARRLPCTHAGPR